MCELWMCMFMDCGSHHWIRYLTQKLYWIFLGHWSYRTGRSLIPINSLAPDRHSHTLPLSPSLTALDTHGCTWLRPRYCLWAELSPIACVASLLHTEPFHQPIKQFSLASSLTIFHLTLLPNIPPCHYFRGFWDFSWYINYFYSLQRMFLYISSIYW